MRFAEVVAASGAVAATTKRLAKIDALAALLRRAAPDEIEAVVGFCTGTPRQGRVGVGWAGMAGTDAPPAAVASLTVDDVDRALAGLLAVTGPGSAQRRRDALVELLGRATADEAAFLGRLLLGELRQGALAGVVTDAVARAAGVPVTDVRRAAMLTGDLGVAARIALTGGAAGLARVGLLVGRPVQPMLAATAPSVRAAIEELGEASVEWKLDGARVQIHRDGDTGRIATRNLNDVTGRLPGVVAATLALPATRLVLDGEVLGVTEDDDGDLRPRAFQDTMSDFATRGGEAAAALTVSVFDVLHADGTDLIDAPLRTRQAVLGELAGPLRVPTLVTADPAAAEAFAADALARGHEGVMVKALDAPYEAGRRGSAWRKVKPVRTVDLVVLAAEWGSGRRTGRLSNLHLGARDPDAGPGAFVMVGKTFKGLTDALLAWQTVELLAREVAREGHVVWVRPELVVEIAVDGVLRSTRYPGGVALRFARVKRYRPDKSPEAADTIDTVRGAGDTVQGAGLNRAQPGTA